MRNSRGDRTDGNGLATAPMAAAEWSATAGTASGSRGEPWWLVTFAREGGAVYLSHLDTARAWQRIFARAGIELALTHGMRPKQRLALGLPLPVGAAAREELLWCEVAESVHLAPALALATLSAAAPPGLRPLSLRTSLLHPRPVPVLAAYECHLAVAAAQLAPALAWFVAAATVPYERVAPKGRRQLDLKEFVTDVWHVPVAGGCRLGFAVRHREDGAARPQEFVDVLATRLGIDMVMRALLRTHVTYQGLPEGSVPGTTIGAS